MGVRHAAQYQGLYIYTLYRDNQGKNKTQNTELATRQFFSFATTTTPQRNTVHLYWAKKIRKILRSQCQNAVQCCRGSVDRVPSYKYRKSVFSKLVDSWYVKSNCPSYCVLEAVFFALRQSKENNLHKIFVYFILDIIVNVWTVYR